MSSKSSSIVKTRAAITAIGVLAVSASAATVDWNASGSPANWSATSSWLGGVLPGTGDIARFNMTATKTMTLDSSQSIDGFQIGNGTLATGTLTVSLSNSQVLTLGASGLTMQPTASAATFSGAGSITLGAVQTWTNFSANGLTVSSNVDNGGNLFSLFGSGPMTFSGTSVISGGGGLYNQNWGIVTLAGANTYTGTTTIASTGTTVLDFSATGAPTDNIINNTTNSSGLAFNGMGTVQLKGKAATTNSQQFNGLTLNRGGATITGNLNGGTALNFTLGSITRNNSSSVDFGVANLGTGTISTTATNDSTGILGPWATVNGGADYATVNGSSQIVALNNTTLTGESGWTNPATNYTTDSTQSLLLLTASRTVNTLRIAGTTANTTITLNGTNTLTANGIINGLGTKRVTISRNSTGTLAIGSSGELVLGGSGTDWNAFANANASSLIIAVPITGTGNVVKIGQNGLQLTQASSFTGNFVLNSGHAAFNNNLAFGSMTNNIVIQGGTLGGINQNSGTLRMASYNQIWAGDFSLADTTNNGAAFDFGTGNITITNGTRTINQSIANGYISGIVGDGGNGFGLVKAGSGAMFLEAVNTYSGPTTTLAGTLLADPGVGLPSASNLVLLGGKFGPFSKPTLSFTLGTGAGQLQIAGTPSFTASLYSYADVNLNSGTTLKIGTSSDSLSTSLGLSGSNGHAVVFNNPLTLTNNSSNTDMTSAAGGGYDVLLVGNIAPDTGLTNTSLRLSTASIFVLAGQATYNQLTGNNSSVIIPTRAVALPASGNIANNTTTIAPRAGAADEWTTNQITSLLTTLGTGHAAVNFGLDVGADPFSFDTSTYTNGGTRTFTKYGSGVLTLSGAAAYTGATTVNQGVLALNAANNIGTALTLSNNTRLDNATSSLLDLSAKTITMNTTAFVYSFGGSGDMKLPALSLTGASTSYLYCNAGVSEIQFPGVTIGSSGNCTLGFYGSNAYGNNSGSGIGGGNFRITNLTANAPVSNVAILQAIGANVILNGITTVNQGSLAVGVTAGSVVLDYSTNSSSKLGTTLVLNGGLLQMNGHASSSVIETITTFSDSFDGGAWGPSRITLNPNNNGGSLTLNLGTITRATYQGQRPVIDFNPVSNGTGTATITTSTLNTNGILSPWASYQQNTWAVNSTNAANGPITGLATFGLTNSFNGTNTTNVDINQTYIGDPGQDVNQNTVRILAGTNVAISGANRTFTTGGLMVYGASDGDTGLAVSGTGVHTISPGYVWVNSTNAAGTAPGRLTLYAAVTGSLTKAGPGILQLTQATANNSTISLSEGTIELAGDNVLPTGNLYLGDANGLAGFAAVGGARTIPNSTAGGIVQSSGTFRGVRFSGDNDIIVTGAWQAGTAFRAYAYVPIISMDASANVTFRAGPVSNTNPGVYILGDANSGSLTITGMGNGILGFVTPVLRATASSGNSTINIRRIDGITELDMGTGAAVVNVNRGVLLIKGTSLSPVDQLKVGVTNAANSNVLTLPDVSLLAVGMAIDTNVNCASGTFITSIDSATKKVTLSRNMTAAKIASDNQALTFQGVGPAGTQQTFVDRLGVLALGANIPVPGTLTSLSSGVIGIDYGAYTQALNLAAYGNGEMYLGSATGGTITGGSAAPGIHSTYRLGGGGGTLEINASNYLAGASNLIVGDANLYKGANTTVKLSQQQSYSGTTIINQGILRVTSTGLINNSSAVTVNSGAIFDYQNTTTALTAPITNNLGGTVIIGAGTMGGPGATVRAAEGSPYGGYQSTAPGDLNTVFQTLTSNQTVGNAGGGYRDLTVGWRMPTGSEANLVSDVLEFNGTGNDLYALQLSYNPSATGQLALFTNTGSGFVLAGNTDLGNKAYNPATDFTLGNYGIDTTNHVAWAVVDHNSEWAVSVVPEPGTLALLAFGAMAVLNVRRKKNK